VELNDHTLRAAIQHNCLQLCQWLRETAQCPLPEYACVDAADRNYLAVLRWLRDSGCPLGNVWEGAVAAVSSCGDDLSLLQYVQHEGLLTQAGLVTDMLLHAGFAQQLPAAQWLRQQGAAWPTELFTEDYSEYRDPFWSGAVLDWARGQGCAAPALLPPYRIYDYDQNGELD
jgi:hypothetical protein